MQLHHCFVPRLLKTNVKFAARASYILLNTVKCASSTMENTMLLPSTSIETAARSVSAVRHDTLACALACVERSQGQIPLLERERDLLLAGLAEAWRLEQYAQVIALVAGLAYIAGRLDDPEQGQRILLQGIHACRETGDKHQAALFLNRLSGLLFAQGQYNRARDMLNESLTIARTLDRPACLWEPLVSFPYLVDIPSNYETVFLLAQTLLNNGQSDDPDTVAVAFFIRGFFYHLAHDEERALNDFSACQSLHAGRTSPSLYKRFFEIEVQAELARVQGDFARARTYTLSALSLAETLCDPYITAVLVWDEAMFAHRRGDFDDIYPLALHLVSLSGHIKAPHYFTWCSFLVKQLPASQQRDVIFAFSRNASPEIAAKLLPSPLHIDYGSPVNTLSRRERDVLRLVAQGCSNREIADRLVITAGTVKKHLEHIYSKLDVYSRTQAVARAREWKILE